MCVLRTVTECVSRGGRKVRFRFDASQRSERFCYARTAQSGIGEWQVVFRVVIAGCVVAFRYDSLPVVSSEREVTLRESAVISFVVLLAVNSED